MERPLRSLRRARLNLPDGAILAFEVLVTHNGADWQRIDKLAARILDSLSSGPVHGFASSVVSIEHSGLKLSMTVPDGWKGSTALSATPRLMIAGFIPELGSRDYGGVQIVIVDARERRQWDNLDNKQAKWPDSPSVLGREIVWLDNRKHACATPDRCTHDHFRGMLPLNKNTFVYITVSATNKKILSEATTVLKSLKQER